MWVASCTFLFSKVLNPKLQWLHLKSCAPLNLLSDTLIGARSGGNSLILDLVSLILDLAFFLFSFKEGVFLAGDETDSIFSTLLLRMDDWISASFSTSLEESFLRSITLSSFFGDFNFSVLSDGISLGSLMSLLRVSTTSLASSSFSIGSIMFLVSPSFSIADVD